MAKTSEKTQEKSKAQAPRTGLINWSPAVAILVVVGVFFGASIIGELVLLIFGLLRGWGVSETAAWAADSSFGQFFSIFIIYTAMALLVVWFVRGRKVPLRALGVVPPKWRDLGIAILAIPVYIAGYALLLFVMRLLFPSIDVEQKQQLGFQPDGSMLALTLTFIGLVVLPPLVEEFIMRGFFFSSLLRRMRWLPAALIVSILFGFAHLQLAPNTPPLWIAAIDTFVLSMVACYMRFRTGSLWPSITLHALKNCVAFLSLFVFHLK